MTSIKTFQSDQIALKVGRTYERLPTHSKTAERRDDK